MEYVNNLFFFSSQFITSDFSSVFCQIFAGISLGDADLHFSIMLEK